LASDSMSRNQLNQKLMLMIETQNMLYILKCVWIYIVEDAMV
jgi:hypothetical protein